jgi:hypothetical protein
MKAAVVAAPQLNTASGRRLANTIAALAVLGVFLFWSGCVSTTQYATVVTNEDHPQTSGHLISDPTKTRIYVLRRYAFVGAGVAIMIADNGRPIGKLGMFMDVTIGKAYGECQQDSLEMIPPALACCSIAQQRREFPRESFHPHTWL